MKGDEKVKRRNLSLDRLLFIGCAISFLLPIIPAFIGFAIKEIAPFGDRTLCSMDGFSQYYPMLENMADAIKEGELFYSFNGALGFNLWAQSAYYTNSPLWLLIYILPHSAQLVGINLMVVLRFCLSSAFFYYRLYSTHLKADEIKKCVIFPVISVCYGLSGYALAFANQFMWADVVMLLPLVILGLERLWEGRKPFLYIITLFLSMWSCFYLSYMVCVFVCLYFLYLAARDKKGLSYTVKKGLIFTGASLLAAALAAVVLIPVYKALSLTLASELGFEGKLLFKYTVREMLRMLLPFGKPSLEFQAPNLYCGLTAVLLLGFALFSKRITLYQKLLSAIFLVFMFFTMSLNLGEYVWHGFHYPNQLPGRQSFLFIFLVLSFLGAFVAVTSTKSLILGAVSVVMCVEVCLNTCCQLGTNVWASLDSSIRRYDGTVTQLAQLEDKELFSRVEWADVNKNNYPQQYSYKGVTYYSSTMSGDAYNFFQQLGIPRYAKNVSVYYYQSDITNALFGLDYVMQPDGITVYHNQYALPLGFVAEREVLDFELYAQEKGAATQKALWLSLTGEKELDLETQAKKLQSQGVEITLFDTDRIEGTVTAEKDGVLLFTIPFDGGWSLKIDGEKIPLSKVAGYLSGAEITAGTHEIEMVYTVPGIVIGGVISGVGVLVLAAWIVVSGKRKMYLQLDK